MACVLLVLITMYVLLLVGAVIFLVTVPVAVHRIMACLDWSAASTLFVNVTSESADSVVVPAIAESNNDVIESLTVLPQAPGKEPVVGRARPRRGVAMSIL
jgi:hypothetical protein